ncbi:MAG: PD40 domain-containing protein, partial [Gemmatimonadetes bacterium]|nr:PD40 domain-containing protein [Gemmatimonadota bacterium]
MRRLLVGLALLPIVAGAQGAAPCLAGLHGTWRGTGRVAGRDVVMQQEWRPALGGAFSELTMTHRLPTDTARIVFEGRGFYRATGDTVSGTWMDARGYTMALRGSCRDQTLAMEWSGAERGATHYTRHADGTLEVVDLVDLPAGRREFGRSRLHRAPPPGELVGRGVISTVAPEFATSVTADGRELFFNRASADRSVLTLMVSTRDPGGEWTAARTLPFSGSARDVDPFLSPDGRRLYFSSDRPRAGRSVASFSTWYVERTATGWSTPVDPGAPLNSDSTDIFVSMSRDGELVFSSTRDGVRRIYTTREANGAWVVPRLLP